LAKIAFFELEEWEKKILEKKFRKHEVYFFSDYLNKENIGKIKDVEILSVFIYSKITKKELDLLPNLKLITTRSTGFDHIDIKECKARGIVVCNVPSYGSRTVAEHTFALILALVKKLFPSVEKTRRGDFTLDNLRTFDLENKKLGIIGLGKIGYHVARLGRAFKMKVLAYSPHTDERFAKKLGVKLVSLDELLKNSDIISLHAPLTNQTMHMINKETISKMKDGVILINTARGALVDSKDLVEALDSGKIAAAGLDVLEEECNIKEERQILSPHFAGECDLKTVLANHILLNKPNVIVTPHNAFNSQEALQRILDTTIENIQSFLNNKPVNTVQ
jgi:D-lactate dehydrogenase